MVVRYSDSCICMTRILRVRVRVLTARVRAMVMVRVKVLRVGLGLWACAWLMVCDMRRRSVSCEVVKGSKCSSLLHISITCKWVDFPVCSFHPIMLWP